VPRKFQEEQDNVVKAADKAAPAVQKPPPAPPAGCVSQDFTGLRVRVHGLINKPEFNNETGMVTGLVVAQGARWCVELDNYKKELSLKGDNLMVLVPCVSE
jgi:hypothetical protein